MAPPIYKLFMAKYTEAWYQLSEEEQNAHNVQIEEAREKVGGKLTIFCTSLWSTEKWMIFGVEEFPDIDAVAQHTQLLFELDHFRYLDSDSMLGVQWPLPESPALPD